MVDVCNKKLYAAYKNLYESLIIIINGIEQDGFTVHTHERLISLKSEVEDTYLFISDLYEDDKYSQNLAADEQINNSQFNIEKEVVV